VLTNRKTRKRPLTQWSKSALAGCDWFVNSQVVQQQPNWDANHGRFMYNVHVPTGTSCRGIGWTQARAVMCLLAGYERTGDKRFMEAAERGIAYAKNLQNMDRRFPQTYGAFHEETPFSPFSYPRDAIEVAEALLQWHLVTGDEDALYRAELFLQWFKRQALTVYPRFGTWVEGSVRFDNKKPAPHFRRPVSCQMGCVTILCHAYETTGKPWHKTTALKIADTTVGNYLPEGKGPLSNPARHRAGRHTAGDAIIYNDDGGAVGLLNAYKVSGKQKYLDAAVQAAEFFRSFDGAIPIFGGVGSVANFLLEADRILGGTRYRKVAERLVRQTLKLQVNSGRKSARGGFRGEDEGGKWYVKGSRNRDFVTTRVTAYSVLALFKFEGVAWPRGYSTRW